MEVEDYANLSCTDAFINEDEWFSKRYQAKPMADVDWIAKYNEQIWPEKDKLRLLQIRLEWRDKVESRVSLTACGLK